MQHMDQTGVSHKRSLPAQQSSQEVQSICNQLLSRDHKIDGLQSLESALQRSSANGSNFLCLDENVMFIDKVFKGIRSCLNVDENDEEVLMRTNQVLYDLMPDILKYPVELQPEISTLIPALVENLGNPKANVRKQTHKVIGTYVKLSKKLEPVLLHLIKHGLGSLQNQRTRQHSMLVIPALLSLKPSVIESRPPPLEMQLLVDEVVARLRDPEEIVSKTARKLLAELHKVYPNHFQISFIDTLSNQDDKTICQFILQGKTEDALRLIQATVPTNPQPAKQQPLQISQTQQQNMQPDTKQVQMAAYGKSIQPQNHSNQHNSQTVVQQAQHLNVQQTPQQQNLQNPKVQGTLIAQGPLKPTQPQGSLITNQNQQIRELSVVGREIIGSSAASQQVAKQLPKQVEIPEVQKQQNSQVKVNTDQLVINSLPQTLIIQSPPLPQKKEPELAFGFIDPGILNALNENNQWKDRTVAIDQLENSVINLKTQLSNNQANELLEFILTLISDINFKISLASLKIIALLLSRKQIKTPTLYTPLVEELVEKLADSKSVVRDATLECCALLIDQFKPQVFMQQIYKNFQNQNWHIREGIQILVARCLLENHAANGDSIQIMSSKIVEELVFSVKVEDKPKLRQIMIDNLALSINLCRDKSQMVQLIQKSLGLKSNQTSETEKEFFDQIIFREKTGALPVIAIPSGRITFQPWTSRQEEENIQKQIDSASEILPRTTTYSQFKQNEKPVTIEAERASSVRSPQPNILQSNHLAEFTQTKNSPLKSQNQLITAKERQNAENMHPMSAGIIKPPINSLKTEVATHSSQIVPQPIYNQSKSQLGSVDQTPISMNQRQITKQSSHDRYLPFQGGGTQAEENRNVQMWLPSFQNQQNDEFRRVNSRISDSGAFNLPDNNLFQVGDEPQRINSRKSDQESSSVQSAIAAGQPPLHTAKKVQRASEPGVQRNQTNNRPNINLEATQSTIPQFDDNQSVFTQTTLVSSSNKPALNNRHSQIQKQISEGNRSPIFSDAKRSSEDSQDNFRNAFGLSQQKLTQGQQNNYIPESHKSLPRTIQSNQDKQRSQINSVGNNSATNSNSNQSSQMSNSNQTSTSAVNTFDKSQINDRLTLLKSTFKYKNSQIDNTSDFGITPNDDIIQRRPAQSENEEQVNAYVAYDNRKVGPVRAAHLNPNEEKQISKRSGVSQPTHVQLKPRQAVSATKGTTNQVVRASEQLKFDTSLDRQNDHNDQRSEFVLSDKKINKLLQTPNQPQLSFQDSVGASYDIIEEPLQNPSSTFSNAIQDLKSNDWSKQFEACNIVRRVSIFHKNIVSQQPSVFKELSKVVESLRSQLSKNACLALQALFSNCVSRDTDPHIDTVLPVLLKRAADTNQFIAEQAEQTLQQIVLHCSETRVFNCFQQQTVKTNQAKEKICQCYTLLVERLGSQNRLRQFVSIDRLVQTAVAMLSESAAEVRNQAKICVFALQTACGSQRELDLILQKCHLNERQVDQVKKVLQSEDLESLSQYVNTRYGQLRGSPAQGYQLNLQKQSSVSGTDGFTRRSAGGNSQMMQQTFLSSNQSVGPNSMQNFRQPQNSSHYNGNSSDQKNQLSNFGIENSQNAAFKKRTTSVSKPIDRDMIEEFKNLVDNCGQSDWSKRVKAIDELQDWASQNSRKIKSASTSSFISLIDAYCKVLQDNNTKVQARAQQSFQVILLNQDLGPLLNSNLTMIVQALTQNLCSTSQNVKNEGEQLLDMLQDVVQAESNGSTNGLIQPIVSQVNLTTCRAKPQLVYRLASLVKRVDKSTLLERYLGPLLQPGNKIQQEANGNQQLKQALASLEQALASAGVGQGGQSYPQLQQY